MLQEFPKRPRTQDETRAELIRLLGVPDYANVFVLGCFARYVTVYSQQVRALNLVDALAKEGVLSPHSAVAVIGAGIAGLTAAAAACVKRVGRVKIFEKHDATMRIQRTNSERYLHPHIYDWPNNDSRSDEAGLPIMNWKAGYAKDVVQALDAAWEKVQTAPGTTRATTALGCSSLQLNPIAGGRTEVQAGAGEAFDVVIISVGFGTDARNFTSTYWANDGIDNPLVESETDSWLVSGFGDGALTDLMRLCIQDFLHQNVLAAANDLTRETVGEDLRREERRDISPQQRVELYKRAADRIGLPFEKHKALAKRRMGKIVLNCSEEQLFSPKSSILNRLIAAALLKEGRFSLRPGKLADISPVGAFEQSAAGFQVRFDGSEPEFFNHLILRHGPHSGGAVKFGEQTQRQLEADFNPIWEATSGIRAIWESTLQYEDWTRQPLYSVDDFDLKKEYRSQLRVSFAGKLGCVVIANSKPHPDPGLGFSVNQALRDFAARMKSVLVNVEIETKPEVISAPDVFDPEAPWKFERAVRTLCDSDLAVFDLTGGESGVVLLLGIRAAARRGVTIPISRDDPRKTPLSFNISSLNPIFFAAGMQRKHNTALLASALEAGFQSLAGQPDSYLDLPVYDAVREVGADPVLRQPERQILVLRWFDDRYGGPLHATIDGYLQNEYGRGGRPTQILTTLDSQSPQLIGQRLYAEIRRTKFCLADWTGWRENVFFEIGVRLAVNPEDPIQVLCTNPPQPWDGTEWPAEQSKPGSSDLKKFFAPIEFDFAQPELLLDQMSPSTVFTRCESRLSKGRVYAIVSQTTDWSKEPGGESIERYLLFRAHLLDGPAAPEDGTRAPVLFAERFTEHARTAAIEHLLAAWYYLLGRYDLGNKSTRAGLSPDDPKLKALIDIGGELTGRMRRAPDPSYIPLRSAIRKLLRELENKEKADG